MAKFLITADDGAQYEIEADDEAAALAGFQQVVGGVSLAPASNEERYQQALGNVRQSQFPDFTDEQWADYSSKILAPSDFNDATASAQLFGFGDEISAGMGALGSQVRQWIGGGGPGFGEAYGQYTELEQARRDLGREQMGEPAALAAEVLGGSTILGPARSVAGALVAPSAVAAPNRVKTALTGLGTGAGMGALYGFGATDGGVAERGGGALVGGTIGGVTGVAAPYLAEAGAGAYGAIRNNLARNAAAADLGIEPAAASILRQVTGADQSLNAPGAANMAAAGREAMLLDAGPNAQQAADYLMRKPGQSATIVSDALTGRAGRDAGELQNALNVYLGDPQGVATLRRNIATSSEAARETAYNSAYDTLIDYNKPEGAAILEMFARLPQSAKASANKLMQAELGPQASLPMNLAQLPTVRDIDYITRALNLEATAGEGAGKLGGMTDLGRAYSILSGDIRGQAKAAAPAYANALETAADPISRSQATKTGYDIFSPNMARDDVAMLAKNMSAPEKEAAALGIRSRIDENLSNVSRAVTTGREDEINQALRAMRDLTKPANRTKIASFIGQQDADLLFEEVDRIFISLQREALRQTGSQTAGRQFMNDVFDPYVNPQGVLATAGQGKPIQAGQRIIQALTGMGPENLAARGDEIGQQVARALVSQGPELAQNLAGLQRYNAATVNNDAVSRALAARLAPAGVPLSYQAAMQTR